jgi:hypothetical protein
MARSLPKIGRTPEPLTAANVYPDQLQTEIQCALATLADVECLYEQRRNRLDNSPVPESVRARLCDRLERRRQRDREPLVQRLAELHQRLISATMFRTLH